MIKKKIITAFAASTFTVSALLLSSCNRSKSPNSISSINSISSSVEIQNDIKQEIYLLAVQSGYEGTYEDWLASIRGEKGIDGKMIELRVFDGYIQWKYTVEIQWNNLIELGELTGENGTPGNNGVTPHIGENGNWWIGTEDTKVKATGENGTPGNNGVTPHIGENGNWWIGTEDTKVKATGENGTPGNNGVTPHIGENGNWWIGTEDTKVKATGENGTSGKSAFEIYCEIFTDYSGTETQWLMALINGELGSKKTYQVTFDSKGGNYNPPLQSIESGKKVVKPTDPIKDGYVFAGWYVENELWSFIGYVVTENIVMTAKWVESMPQAVTLNQRGGANGTSSIIAIYGDVMPVATAPTKPGYIFTGYYDELTGGNRYYNYDMSSARNWDKNGEATLYARWQTSGEIIDNLVFNIVFDENKNESYGISGNDNTLTEVAIPSSYNNLPVTTISASAFSGYNNLREIDIPNSVTVIGDNAFKSCTVLTDITLPSSIKTIGKYAFSFMSLLSNINIPNGVVNIGDNAFNYCRILDNITIPESVKTIGEYAFANCIDMKKFMINGENLLTIGSFAFQSCYKLDEVILPDSVTSIGTSTFSGCSALRNVKLSNKLVSIDSTFSGCSSLETIVIPDGVKSINSLIKDNSVITSITIPASVITIYGYAIWNCSNLSDVNVIGLEEADKPASWYNNWLYQCPNAVINWDAQ